MEDFVLVYGEILSGGTLSGWDFVRGDCPGGLCPFPTVPVLGPILSVTSKHGKCGIHFHAVAKHIFFFSLREQPYLPLSLKGLE